MSGSDGDVAVLGNEMEAVVSPGSQPGGAAAGVNLDSIANGSRQLVRIVKRRRCRGAETAVSPGVSRGVAAGVFCVSVADGSGPLARIVERRQYPGAGSLAQMVEQRSASVRRSGVAGICYAVIFRALGVDGSVAGACRGATAMWLCMEVR